MKRVLAVSVCACFISAAALADTVRGIDIEFVTIGNPGNHGDTRTGYYNGANPPGCGAVDYEYRIGKYEITANQWQIINNIAKIDNSWGWSGTQPVANISWYSAARFCNYLTTGDTERGVYTFIQGSLTNIMDHELAGSTYGAAYFLPTEDEWYKAAYYTGSGYTTFANGTNNSPRAGIDTNYGGAYSMPWNVGAGTIEQNGTFNIMGNVTEWTESIYDPYDIEMASIARGGSFNLPNDFIRSSFRTGEFLSSEHSYVGIRVASIVVPVPEPAAATLLALGALLIRKRRT